MANLASPNRPHYEVVGGVKGIPLKSKFLSPLAPHGLVFAVALALRVIHLIAVSHSPFDTVLLGDAQEFDGWAQRIAGGEVWGTEVFYHAPLYPYLMAIVYALAGHNLFVIRLTQAIIGAGSCVILSAAGTRLFDRRVGLVAGFLLAIYPPIIFHDLIIQKTVLDTFFMAILAYLLACVTSLPKPRYWLAIGLTVGGIGLTRENALALIPIIIVWLFVQFRTFDRPTRLAWAGTMVIGSIVMLGPVAFRNWMVGGEFALTTSNVGVNLYIGNHPEASGFYEPLRPGRGGAPYERADATDIAESDMGRTLRPVEVAAYWLDQSFTFIAEQPTEWTQLLWRKWLYFWNAAEIGDSEDQASYAEFSPVLRAPLAWLGFGVVFPIAVLGVCLTWSQRRRLWIFYLIVLAMAAGATLFFILGRFRLPVVPVLMLFAAAGLVELVRLIRIGSRFGVHHKLDVTQVSGPSLPKRSVWSVAIIWVCVAGALTLTHWPVLRGYDPRLVTWSNLGYMFNVNGDYDRAIFWLERVIDLAPEYPEARNNLASALLGRGDYPGAIHQAEEALRLSPELLGAHLNLTEACLAIGRFDEAEASAREALRIMPESGYARERLAAVLEVKEKARSSSQP